MAVVSRITIGKIQHITVNSDPRIDGADAPLNSIAHIVDQDQVFLKSGILNTDWRNITLPSVDDFLPDSFYTLDPVSGNPVFKKVESVGEVEVFRSTDNSPAVLQKVKMYEGIFSTSAGTLTFHLTDDGTATGNPLFTGLSLTTHQFQITLQRNTDSNAESPWGHIRSIQNGGRSVVVQLKKSNQGGILLGGTYFGNLNNNNAVIVYLKVSGV